MVNESENGNRRSGRKEMAVMARQSAMALAYRRKQWQRGLSGASIGNINRRAANSKSASVASSA
jgi:hypothetical protein